jgi:photosystem II stability/assembly factor-like uncharacterized protein
MLNGHTRHTFATAVLAHLCLWGLVATAHAQSWERVGTTWGGSVNALQTLSDGRVLAATGAGIYYSLDSGRSWTRAVSPRTNDGFNAFSVATDGSIYAACNVEGGVHRSTDQGLTWTSVSGGTIVTSAAVLAEPSGKVIAGSTNGVYTSTNQGASWTFSSSGMPSTIVWHLLRDTSGFLYASTSVGLYRSTNGGSGWSQVKSGIDVQRCALSPSGAILCAAFGSGIYRSTDQGVTWTVSSSGIVDSSLVEIWTGPNGVVYAGSAPGGSYRSTDDGLTWTRNNQGLTYASVRSHAQVGDGLLLCGTGGDGVFRSTDAGLSWVRSDSGMLATTGKDFDFDQSGAIYYATTGGVFRSTDGGTTWAERDQGLTFRSTQTVHVLSNGSLLAGQTPGIHRSTDEGMSWSLIANSPRSVCRFVETSTGVILAASWGFGVFRSTDGGSTWTASNSGLTNLQSICLARSQSGILYLGTADNGQGVFRSTDHGATWTRVTASIPHANVYALEVHWSGAVLAGFRGLGGLWISTDEGSTWTQQLGNVHVWSIATHEADADGDSILVGVYGEGVALSTDHGMSWGDLSSGLGPLSGFAMKVIPRGPYRGHALYGTYAWGVYRSKRFVTEVDDDDHAEQPGAFALDQNYPNPFNPSTQISFSMPQASHIRLTVHDLLGRTVAVLADETREAGQHKLTWNAERMPSGIYLARLHAGAEVRTVRMMLVR